MSGSERHNTLGVAEVIDTLRAALLSGNAVLEAEPGAGKSTGVPLALLSCEWLAGRRIVMLEPRRLAARAVAERLASNLGEPLGQTVGLATRDDRVGGVHTRIDVITEGLLTRRLQDDPELAGVGLVIFDEFHERSVQSDLALALCLDAQSALRPNLRLLMMSATVDRSAITRVLDDAPLIQCAGRQHPVEVHWRAQPPASQLVPAVCTTVTEALSAHDGDVLVFLPGLREIRQVEQRLSAQVPEGVEVLSLHGSLGGAAQRRALQVSDVRRVVVASAIAETSITLPGVRVVVDAGLERRAECDVSSGVTQLRTVEASQASATQRAGRAGRTAPGWCYRLWREEAHARRVSHWQAEIEHTELSDLVLQLRLWGVHDASALRWQDPPSPARVNAAESLLIRLGALDDKAQITTQGRVLARLGMPVRLGMLALLGQVHGCVDAAVSLACALLEPPRGEKDAVAFATAFDRQRHARNVKRVRQRLKGVPAKNPRTLDGVIARAFADRLAVLRDGSDHRYQLSNGVGAELHEHDSLRGTHALVAFELSGSGRDARITRGQALDLPTALETGELITVEDVVQWDARREQVVAERRQKLGAITLRTEPLTAPDDAAIGLALMNAVREQGLSVLAWSDDERAFQYRVALLRALDGVDSTDVPACDDAALLGDLAEWLAPAARGIRRLSALQRVPLLPLLQARLPWAVRERLDQLCPTHVVVPSGRRAALTYREDGVDLKIKLQELFGLDAGPRVAGGRMAVSIHLLSPAGRPLAVTQDLHSFWRNAYADVRKQMRGRYPKHPWPDDPLSATPTAHTKARAAGVNRKP